MNFWCWYGVLALLSLIPFTLFSAWDIRTNCPRKAAGSTVSVTEAALCTLVAGCLWPLLLPLVAVIVAIHHLARRET